MNNISKMDFIHINKMNLKLSSLEYYCKINKSDNNAFNCIDELKSTLAYLKEKIINCEV